MPVELSDGDLRNHEGRGIAFPKFRPINIAQWREVFKNVRINEDEFVHFKNGCAQPRKFTRIEELLDAAYTCLQTQVRFQPLKH
jgi:hypothetical protein